MRRQASAVWPWESVSICVRRSSRLRVSRSRWRRRFFACITAVRWSHPARDEREASDPAFLARVMKVNCEASAASDSSPVVRRPA